MLVIIIFAHPTGGLQLLGTQPAKSIDRSLSIGGCFCTLKMPANGSERYKTNGRPKVSSSGPNKNDNYEYKTSDSWPLQVVVAVVGRLTLRGELESKVPTREHNKAAPH